MEPFRLSSSCYPLTSKAKRRGRRPQGALRALAAAGAFGLLAPSAQADVLRIQFSTQIALGSGPGFNQSAFLNEFGVTSPNGITASGHVDIDRSVIPTGGGVNVFMYIDAIRELQLTIGNKALGFRDNPAVSGGYALVSDSPGDGWDRISFATPALNALAARPSNETAPVGSPAHSFVFDWAAASTLANTYFGLSSLYLDLNEYNMLSSRDLNATGLAQPMPSISQSKLNFELVMSASPTAAFFAPSNARYYGQSTSGFSLSAAPLEPGGSGEMPEPTSLALAVVGLLGALALRPRSAATRTASSL